MSDALRVLNGRIDTTDGQDAYAHIIMHCKYLPGVVVSRRWEEEEARDKIYLH